MNTKTHATGPSATAATAAHADDVAVAAYRKARQMGASREAAAAAFDSAYREALRG